MKKNLLSSQFITVFVMILSLFPLLFILVKRYFSYELIPFSFVNSLIMAGGMLLNIFVFRQLSGKVKSIYVFMLIGLSSAGFAISGFIYVLLNHPLFFLYGMDVVVSYILIVFIIITALSVFTSLSLSYQKAIEIERKKKEMEIKLRQEMERQIYSSKISPHFLFNSLNLMVSVLDDKDKAEHILMSLSELLRYNLDASKKRIIPLRDELSSVEKYLYIQKARFGNRLDYEITGKSNTGIPPLLLQPLVENSIKHNLDELDYIKIVIDIKDNDSDIQIRIKDSESKLNKDMIGHGTGLEITRQRVEISGGTFIISDGGVEICLPKK